MKLATLEERERRAVMALVDARLATDKYRADFETHPDPAVRTEAKKHADEGQIRIDALLIQHATRPDQGERITKMADVMYKVAKTLGPLKVEDRGRVLRQVRQQFLANGESAAVGMLDHHIDVLKKEREELQDKYDTQKNVVDVIHLRKDRPRYVRQLEWVEKTWGAVPLRDWLGTDRHKALVAGIEREVSVERFIAEILGEVAGHLAWSPVNETEALLKEMAEETVPMMAATLDWTRAGCPVFSLTDDFFHALAVTDFGTDEDDKEDVLHMPFPAFVVNFPPNALVDARRMFVYRVGRFDGQVVEWPTTRISLASPGTVTLTQWPSGISRWDFFHDKRLNGQGDMDMARRILANMLSYIEANHGLPKEKHKHGTEAAPVEREHSEPRFRVGRTVKLAPQIRNALREGTSGARWKLGHRHIVRGHWRNQAHGPKRSLRTRKWIEPFWKGPATIDEAFERSYSVEAVTVDVDVSDL